MNSGVVKILIGSFISVLLLLRMIVPSNAAVANWQKSASINPRSSTDFSSATFKQSLTNLRSTGANFVTLVIPYYQASVNSIDIVRANHTPTDASLIDAINFAHSLGMQVTLVIHLEASDTNWRANINPSDRAGWFANYEKILLHYAQIAQTHSVAQYILGAEIINMASDYANPTNSSYWRPMIDNVRNVYKGKLSYSAQRGYGATNDWYNEQDNVKFWDKLDYLGISAYYELAKDKDNPTDAEIISWWNYVDNDLIRPFYQRQGKPIIFTEIGYRSVVGGNRDPWNWPRPGEYDPTIQARLYDHLIKFWNDKEYFSGIHLWDWSSNPDAGGPGNTDYTPQNKPAQEVMKQWFTSGTATATPSPSPTPTNETENFSINVQSNPVIPEINSQAIINSRITSNKALTGTIVDVEIFNSTNQKVHQQYFENQNISSTPIDINVFWKPNQSGSYTVKIGIFSNDWSTLHLWEDNALTIKVTTSPNSPSPTPTPLPTASSETQQIEIWWPTENTTIGGTLPFKAILTSVDINQYDMFWQVDGGVKNIMYNSNQDYPHKESWVDVSSWNWNSTGSYTLTFLAVLKDGSEHKKDIKVNISN